MRAKFVSLDDLAPFYNRLATLLGASVPIARAFESLGGSGHEYLDSVVDNIYKNLTHGSSLSQALSRYPNVFSPIAIGLVAAGERSGHLVDVLRRLAELTEQQLRLKRMVISSLSYPVILCVSTLGLAVLFATVMGSQKDALFGHQKTLPWPTQVLVLVADVLTNPFFVVLLPLLAFGLVFLLRQQIKSNTRLRLAVHKMVLESPLVGALIKRVNVARILYTVGLCSDVGISVLPAFALAQRTCANEEVARQLKKVHQEIADGGGVAEAMTQTTLFPVMVVSMTEVGEQTGELSKIFVDVSKGLEDDLADALMALAQTLEPLFLIGAGAVAGFVALGALGPMLQLLQTF